MSAARHTVLCALTRVVIAIKARLTAAKVRSIGMYIYPLRMLEVHAASDNG
jgi:hypothetical protein